jgi:uncharacterized membrane protein
VTSRAADKLRKACLFVVFIGIIAISLTTALVWLAGELGLEASIVHQFGAFSLMAVLAICGIAVILIWLAGGFARQRLENEDDKPE